jgi:hypothetical protein
LSVARFFISLTNINHAIVRALPVAFCACAKTTFCIAQ